MKSIWTEVKSALKNQIPDHSFRMWIEPVSFKSCSEETIKLICPNYFSKKRLQDQYRHLIEEAFYGLSGNRYNLHFEISTPKTKSAVTGKSSAPVRGKSQLMLPGIGNPVMRSGRMLSRDYTFDEFVVGGNNDFAYSAALSLASGSPAHNNTLFLLSDTGMGKSHLSQAIGHKVIKEKPSEKVYYITAEDFTNEMISALQSKTSDTFKKKYRNQCDVLLLEDVHFLSGKEHTQIELAMTLDYLFESGKKIMFSSCSVPGEIPRLNDQLKSRFTSCLFSKIDAPGFKTRVRILKKKAERACAEVPHDIIEYLADELTCDVRQLESGLNSVVAKSSLLGVPIDFKLAESVIETFALQRKAITIDVIKHLVSEKYGITVNEMISKSRKQGIVRPRQIAMYLSRKYTDRPLQAIGRSFNRYHATAMHAFNSVESGIKNDVAIKNNVEYLSKKLESGKFK